MAIIRIRANTKAGLKIKLKGNKGHFNVDRHTVLEINDKTGIVKFRNYFYDANYIKYNGVEQLLLNKIELEKFFKSEIVKDKLMWIKIK
jgi:hypothetical protein